MFSKNQSLVLGGVFLANLLISVTAPALINNVGPTGPAGSTGVSGLPGSQGPAGEDGADGREVEFRVEGNVLQWRYEGETTWNNLDLDFGNGGGSIVSTGGTSAYTHWIFSEEALSIPFPTLAADPTITNSTTYAAAKVLEGYTAIGTLAELETINADPTAKYVLTADIDLSERLAENVTNSPFNIFKSTFDENFNPIPFSGIFDGAGFTLSNFTVDNTVENVGQLAKAALFDYARGATFKNLTLDNFSFTTNDPSYQIGALVGEVLSTNKPTIVDNVHVTNFAYENGNSNFYQLGGLFGQTTQESVVRVYRSSVEDMTVTMGSTNGTSTFSGAIAGDVNGFMIVGDTTANITFNTEINETSNHRIDQVGGAIGEIGSHGTFQVNNSNFEIVGELGGEVGGLVGGTDSYAKMSITNTNTLTDISATYGYEGGWDFGGLVGSIETNTLTLINNVETFGTISGRGQIGGLIGMNEGRSLLRIENSTSNIDIFGSEDLGGIIGEINENSETKVLFDNVTSAGSISNYIVPDQYINDEFENVGGFIGYVDTSDDSDEGDWTQFWIRNSTVEEFVVTINPTITEGIDDALDEVDFNDTYSDIGGAVGYLYEYAFFRLSNNVIDLTIEFNVQNNAFAYAYLDLEDVGGLFGTIEYENNIQLLNNTSTVNINLTFADNVSSETTPSSFLGFTLENIGGAIGYLEEADVIDVSGDYILNFALDLSNNDLSFIALDFEMYNIGGYIGLVENDAYLILASVNTELDINATFSLLANPAFTLLEYEFYNIGSFVGSMNGFAFLQDVTTNATTEVVLPEAGEFILVDVRVNFDDVQFTGNNNTFMVVTTTN
jgi:hypothetical protein